MKTIADLFKEMLAEGSFYNYDKGYDIELIEKWINSLKLSELSDGYHTFNELYEHRQPGTHPSPDIAVLPFLLLRLRLRQ